MDIETNIGLVEQECEKTITCLLNPSSGLDKSKIQDCIGYERMMIKSRVNQQAFRKYFLDEYSFRCFFIDLEEPVILIASHIFPWGFLVLNSFNPCNALFFSRLRDQEFDRSLISFNNELEMIISSKLKNLKVIVLLRIL